mmetsp:Transcript_10246/g.18687  ORF Transcript_10246/g.18687 Transcript_10246/m.18687 type:complete len:103 (-) Transcript_10246:392-700(-)
MKWQRNMRTTKRLLTSRRKYLQQLIQNSLRSIQKSMSSRANKSTADKMNWLNLDLEYDALGKTLLDVGLTRSRIEEWSKDPQIQVSDSSRGSVFDELEYLDV